MASSILWRKVASPSCIIRPWICAVAIETSTDTLPRGKSGTDEAMAFAELKSVLARSSLSARTHAVPAALSASALASDKGESVSGIDLAYCSASSSPQLNEDVLKAGDGKGFPEWCSCIFDHALHTGAVSCGGAIV